MNGILRRVLREFISNLEQIPTSQPLMRADQCKFVVLNCPQRMQTRTRAVRRSSSIVVYVSAYLLGASTTPRREERGDDDHNTAQTTGRRKGYRDRTACPQTRENLYWPWSGPRTFWTGFAPEPDLMFGLVWVQDLTHHVRNDPDSDSDSTLPTPLFISSHLSRFYSVLTRIPPPSLSLDQTLSPNGRDPPLIAPNRDSQIAQSSLADATKASHLKKHCCSMLHMSCSAPHRPGPHRC